MNLRHLVLKTILFSFFGLFFVNQTYAGIDLELSQTTTNTDPVQYSNFSMTLTVTNSGDETATNVVVELPISNIADIVYSGGNEFTASQGVFYPYGTEIWEVGSIPAGESATIIANYFVLDENTYTIYAQVLNADQTDSDSTPNNGTPPTPNEDDESALVFNDGGGNCQITAFVSNLQCNDALTPNDPSDDNFTFTITADNDSGITGTWATETPSGDFISAAYGDNWNFSFPIANFPSGVVEFVITGNDCASTTISVAVPAPCSDGNGDCNLNVSTGNIQCFDTGTSNDGSDDTWSFDITVTGENTGAFWTTSINGQSFSGNYNETVTLGLFNIVSGSFDFTITDSEDTGCFEVMGISPPAPCSNGSNLPDLTVSNLVFPPTISLGATINVTFDLSNIGNIPASGNFRVGTYLSTDNAFSFDDIASGFVDLTDFPVGTQNNVSATLSFGANSPQGEYYVILVADDTAQIDESNENNNVLVSTTTITATNESDVCQILVVEELGIDCQNAGTPNNIFDDTYTATLKVTATSECTGDVLIDGQSVGPFDADQTVTITTDPYLISEGDRTIFVSSNNSTNSLPVGIEAPGPCSTNGSCQISGQLVSVDCSNNGTPNNPNDDNWGFVLFIEGINASNNWFFELGNATYSGAYNQELTFTNFPLNGPETLVLNIQDQTQPNCTTQIVIDAPFPCESGGDLADIELSMTSNSTAGAFEFISFDITVTNTGAEDATGLFIRVPVPDNTVLQGGNSYTSTGGLVTGFSTVFWSFPTLAVNQTETLTVNYFTLSEDPITGYAQVVDMVGDDFDSTPNNGTPPIPNEDDEAAFTLGGVATLPDLTVSNLIENFPSVLDVDVDYPFTFDLNNIGNTLAAGDFRVGAYLSLDQNFDANDILVGEILTGNIANTTTINGLINIENSTPSQDYFFILVADDLNDIVESNENNNELSTDETFTVFNTNDNCTGTFTANTQAELNAFNQNCTTWAGSIVISGSVTDLSPLSNLDIILGNLILDGSQVSDLSPLGGLQEAGTLFLYFNDNLTTLIGLPSQLATTSVQIIGNPNLLTINGFPNTIGIEDILIANNDQLFHVNGLNVLTGSHPDLGIVIADNDNFQNLMGFVNLTELDLLLITGSGELQNLFGLNNLVALDRLEITNNPMLSNCCTIFDLLNDGGVATTLTIENNPMGCSSPQDILDTCNPNSCEITATVLDIQCQHNQTLNDASDDTFTGRILVEGNSECFGNFLIDGQLGGIFGSSQIFGAQATVGPFLISNGDVMIEITDFNGDGSTFVTLTAPSSCSNGADPEDCGFDKTYPSLAGSFNFNTTDVSETGTGYLVDITANSGGNPPLSDYNLNLNFAGEEISNTETVIPFNTIGKLSDGNFITAIGSGSTGITYSKVNSDVSTTFWTITVDYDFPGPQSAPNARDLIELADGIAFLVAINGPVDHGYLTKVDASGNLIFNNNIQQTNGFLNYNFDEMANNGDFLIYRQSSSRVGHLIRVSAAGNFLFEEGIIGDLVTSRFGGFAETPDGNFVYASYRDQLTPTLEKVDAFTGERIWILNLNGTFSPGGIGYHSGQGDVVATLDGGAVVGYTFSPGFGSSGDSGYEYGRVNANGNMVWWHHLSSDYVLNASLALADGGFIFTGLNSGSYSVIKTTSEGFLTPTCVDNGGECSISATAVNIFCDDQGTPDNPLDDKFGFDLLVTGQNTGTAYTATENSTGQMTGGLYDTPNTYPELFFIQNGASFFIQDNDDSNCTTLLTVTPPAPCSNGGECSLSATVLSTVCNDQGTTDPSDDTFDFEFVVNAQNSSSSIYNLSGSLPQTLTLDYGTTYNFTDYPVSGGDLQFTATDFQHSNCQTDFSVVAPNTCSGGGNGVDLELGLSTSSVIVSAFDFITVTATVSNEGDENATGIIVDFPLPAGVNYEGGNEFTASQGTYAPYGNQEWNVGSLAAGESATLAVNYFVLGGANPMEFYSQVIAQNEPETDSSPNNGTPPTTNEDDEAILMIAKSGAFLIGNDNGINQSADFESLDFQLLKLYPNPVANNLTLEIGTATDGIAQIKLMNLQGQILQFSERELIQGLNRIKMNVSELPKGVHFVFIQKEDNQEVVRFVRQ